jgi:excisionase family DNA binding protein
MTIRDVAGFLAVDEKTIYRLAQQGKLPGLKVSGTWRFQLQDIQVWINAQKRDCVQAGVGSKGPGRKKDKT